MADAKPNKPAKPTKSSKSRQLQRPKGTRDVYPEDMLRHRYIAQAWRDTAIRHGFDEIDGPTFEDSELYAVKSGEGILGELFQAFSGKDPKDVEFIKEHERAQLALRPEFTPTLARMYAARAKQLPSPTKWFCVSNFFRAERPQRGRLREFWQWNCDILGCDSDGYGETMDADMFAVVVDLAVGVGLSPNVVRLNYSDRRWVADCLQRSGVSEDDMSAALQLLDARLKLDDEVFRDQASAMQLDIDSFDAAVKVRGEPDGFLGANSQFFTDELADAIASSAHDGWEQYEWHRWDSSIVRGLAYYTGTVFELIADGERAVAGGGRYDNLIELFGGPPTPAVGFGMGDVVLSLLLEDKGLMPDGPALLDALSRPSASLRPEAFVVTPDGEHDGDVRTLVADLRRGIESEAYRERDDAKPWDADRYAVDAGGVPPLHARQSYKATRKVPKLMQDAIGQHAKTLVIIENEEHATVQDLDRKEKHERVLLADVGRKVAEIVAQS
ncbi:MAG: ATP phosphoribosyltransferase regulatory subunit [Planctomycetota bacterium]